MPLPLEIDYAGTPNPNAVKLTLNRIIAEKGQTFRDPATADQPWANALLAIPGIVGVFGVSNFITVTKAPEADWQVILPTADEALKRVFNQGGAA